jgi:hypothetical protein
LPEAFDAVGAGFGIPTDRAVNNKQKKIKSGISKKIGRETRAYCDLRSNSTVQK